ncbi:DUF92 domain-containing protein [Chitinophaga sp. Cy-1792]|uniref:DUF92 domain-containing protein n=1 Tax=Chitinophaga sp. Cy-1792 TaxID=2608339 RepID=UPI001422D12D|nr:DUF92 domain-containing protein [Chitinophaga sp. Cy-1792]NIG55148.1 DUF92 domain-containing protein [Chitinophaga sp. Cy-1792]
MLRIIVIILVIFAAVAAVMKKKLTIGGGIAGFLVATSIYVGTGYLGLLLLAVFFLSAVWATKHKQSYKEALKGIPAHSQQRDAWQVLANGGVAAFVAGILLFELSIKELEIIVAASLAAATADTLSSELGTVYGKRFYNILSFKRDQRGLDGVVSLEGTLIGAAGAAMIALIYACFHPRLRDPVIIFIGGILGNYFDSLLGAAFERKGWIKNDMVNFLTTGIAAVIAFILISFL